MSEAVWDTAAAGRSPEPRALVQSSRFRPNMKSAGNFRKTARAYQRAPMGAPSKAFTQGGATALQRSLNNFVDKGIEEPKPQGVNVDALRRSIRQGAVSSPDLDVGVVKKQNQKLGAQILRGSRN